MPIDMRVADVTRRTGNVGLTLFCSGTSVQRYMPAAPQLLVLSFI